MLVKIDDNNNVVQYPYTFANLRADFPNVSFPDDWNESTVNYFGAYTVQPTERPSVDYMTSRLTESVEFINEKWTQVWTVEQISEESAIINARAKRQSLLAETDWMALSDNTLTEEWGAYRQVLRDIPQQEGFPFEVVWPVKPS